MAFLAGIYALRFEPDSVQDAEAPGETARTLPVAWGEDLSPCGSSHRWVTVCRRDLLFYRFGWVNGLILCSGLLSMMSAPVCGNGAQSRMKVTRWLAEGAPSQLTYLRGQSDR